MTLAIPDDDPRARAARLAGASSLRLVRIASLSATTDDPATPPPFKADINITPAFERDGDVLIYQMGYEVTIGTDDRCAARIGCLMEAVYQLPDGFDAETGEYEAFGDVTVLFALHPYLRELVQSMTARLGLPPVTIDHMRIPLRVAPQVEVAAPPGARPKPRPRASAAAAATATPPGARRNS